MDIDVEWEKWGQREPYFGVITDPQYRRANFGEEQRQQFFASGVAHVQHVMRVCRERLSHDFAPRSALDFGCGVGRITLALAEVCETVVGVDVSPAMLREAEDNGRARGVLNVKYLLSDNSLSQVGGQFDFIHSFIVFQHLEIKRGRGLFALLIDRLAPEGICAAHFTYAKASDAATLGRPSIRESPDVPPSGPDGDPVMLMNSYDLNELLFLMQHLEVKTFFTEFTDHGGELGVFLYFQRAGLRSRGIKDESDHNKLVKS